MTPPTKAAVYARVSRPDETAIMDNQVVTLTAYCAAKDLAIEGRIYTEIASGGSDNRSALNELMRSVGRPGGPKVVVFTSLSRMTRGGIGAALYILKQLENAGVGWHFTDQPILNYDSGTPPLARDILLAVLAAIDEDYRRAISLKTKASYTRRKALAEAQGRTFTWGKRGPGKKRGPPLWQQVTLPHPEKTGRLFHSEAMNDPSRS